MGLLPEMGNNLLQVNRALNSVLCMSMHVDA